MFGLTPFFYVLMALYFALIVAMGWMVYDSSRPIRAKRLADIARMTDARREPLSFYQLFGGSVVVLYLLQLIFGFLTFLPAWLRGGIKSLSAVWTLLGLGCLVLYLLRVVFPKLPDGTSFSELAGQPTTPTDRDFKGGHPPPDCEAESPPIADDIDAEDVSDCLTAPDSIEPTPKESAE